MNDENLIDNTSTILQNIEKVDPKNPLLNDTSPSNAYRLLALQKIETNNLDAALALVESGIEFSDGSDQRLVDLKDKIVKTQSIARLESELGVIQGQLTSLTDFKGQQESIVELSNLNPNSGILSDLSTQFKPIIESEFNNVVKDGSREDAEVLASDFGDLMNGLQLGELLTKIKLAKLSGDERKQKVAEFAQDNIQKIETALADEQVGNAQWETDLLKQVQGLSSLVQEDESIAPDLKGYQERIANLYIDKAKETLQSNVLMWQMNTSI